MGRFSLAKRASRKASEIRHLPNTGEKGFEPLTFGVRKKEYQFK